MCNFLALLISFHQSFKLQASSFESRTHSQQSLTFMLRKIHMSLSNRLRRKMREKDIAIVLSVRDIKKEGTIACTTMMMEFLDIYRGKKTEN